MGIPTSRKKDFWSVTAVSGIATDRWYTGKDLTTFNYKRQMDTVTKKSLATKRPEEERIKIPDGIVPPIISVECWEATQEALQRNKQFSARNNSHPKGVGILRCGLAKCGICGYTMQVLHLYRS